MFSVVFLLALLAFSVTGSPVEVRNSPVTLPMTRKLAFSNVTDLLRNDEARLAAFGAYSTHGRRDADVNYPLVPLSHAILGDASMGYTVEVAIGNPPILYNLIVDSASAITWVGARLPYLSRSGIDTKKPVEVNYRFGSEFFRGTIFLDRLYLTEEININAMQIGVASTSNGIAADGILGIGPASSGLGALQNSPGQTIPTVTECLSEQGTIGRTLVGIFFQPITANKVNHGELTFGGTDTRMYDSPLIYTSITTTVPSSRYWGINQSIIYGHTEILAHTAGVVDSGCTFLYLAIDAYERYRAVTGSTLNPANGLLQISHEQYDKLLDLEFKIEYRTYKLIPNAQIWPRSLNYNINGGDNDIFLIVKALATPTGSGCDFVNGYVFLQRFYTAFDSDNRRVGFAKTLFTNAIIN